jgi:DNA ligase (NAD+)
MLITHEEYLAAVKRATKAAQLYYHSADQIMTDAEYDTLIENIRAAGKVNGWTEGNDVVNKVAGGTKPKDVTITHSVPMLSLDKLTGIVELKKFIALLGEKNVVLEPKLDGTALSVVYKNGKLFTAAGRGTGTSANDLTTKVKASIIKGLPLDLGANLNIEIRGELYITDADFELAQIGREINGKKLFSNSRNAVAGAMNDEKDNSYIPVTFGAYEALGLTEDSYKERMKIIASYGFSPAIHLMPASLDKFATIEEKIEEFGKIRPVLGLLTDGIVLKCDSYTIRAAMGEGSHGPRYNKAWKYNADEKRGDTIVTAIDYTIGKTGRLGIVGRLKPVQLDTLVSNVSLHNVKWVTDRDIRVGSKITMLRRNGVIPYLESVNENPAGTVKWTPPVTCPQCDGPFDKSTQLWRCTNPECSILGSVLYAGSKEVLDWEDFSTAVATLLVESGRVNNVADVFDLSLNELINLSKNRVTVDGKEIVLGEKIAIKIYNNIQRSKKLSLAHVINSLAIRKMGTTMSKRVAAYFMSMDAIEKASIADFENINGVAENKATEYYNGFKARKEIIARLRGYGVNMSDAPTANSATAPALVFKNKEKICVTGSMKGTKLDGLSRLDMVALIEKNGGESAGSVSSSTKILVCGEEGSSKYLKAKALGTVKIMTPNKFAELLGM